MDGSLFFIQWIFAILGFGGAIATCMVGSKIMSTPQEASMFEYLSTLACVALPATLLYVTFPYF